MSKRILITGGAGFIGSHLADELLAFGYRVRVLDNLCEQVHGKARTLPGYLHPEVDFMEGDVRDPNVIRCALRDIDAVYHLAAAVGVGQSMYEIEKYTDVNNRGTAVLLEAVMERPVERLIIASSMSLYGEGLYRSVDGELKAPPERPLEQLKAGKWELHDAKGERLEPLATPETKPPSPSSIYALSKYDQERMCLMIGQAYRIPTVALRFFNAYGTRQALSNPYTGVLAIFASRYLNDKRPLIFEDGRQMRDFVSVYDVAQACRLALEVAEAAGRIFNVGSGRAYSVLEIAVKMARLLGKEQLEPEITGQYRVGDIRHCFADIRSAQAILGYVPKVTLEEGLPELAAWVKRETADDYVDRAQEELARKGLCV